MVEHTTSRTPAKFHWQRLNTMSNQTQTKTNKQTKTQDDDARYLRQLAAKINSSSPQVATRLTHIANNHEQMQKSSHRKKGDVERNFYAASDEHLIHLRNGSTIVGKVLSAGGYVLIVETDTLRGKVLVHKHAIDMVEETA